MNKFSELLSFISQLQVALCDLEVQLQPFLGLPIHLHDFPNTVTAKCGNFSQITTNFH